MRRSRPVGVHSLQNRVSVHFDTPGGAVYPFDFPLWWSTDVARFVSVGYGSAIVADARDGASGQAYVYFHRVYDDDTGLSLAEYGKKAGEVFSSALGVAVALV
ncbi:hypothetical protein [Pyrobaculum sp.]|uniref:hypothetical protein n=1 Tax=Pyrobaculum sp. TaxID=2004705 RepID=UPI003D12633A